MRFPGVQFEDLEIRTFESFLCKFANGENLKRSRTRIPDRSSFINLTRSSLRSICLICKLLYLLIKTPFNGMIRIMTARPSNALGPVQGRKDISLSTMNGIVCEAEVRMLLYRANGNY